MVWTPSILGGFSAIELRDGRSVWLEVDASHLTLHVGPARARLAYPPGGYGGHELLAAPDESRIALWLYSGQSEIGCELFGVEPLLHHASFPYACGEGTGPSFSPDSQRLVLAWTANPRLDLDDAPLDAEGFSTEVCELDWAEVRVTVPNESPHECTLRLRVPAGSYFEREASFYPVLQFGADGALTLYAPGGAPIALPWPLPDTLTLEAPLLPKE